MLVWSKIWIYFNTFTLVETTMPKWKECATLGVYDKIVFMLLISLSWMQAIKDASMDRWVRSHLIK